MERFIQPFIEGSEEVFRNLCNTEIKAGRAYFVSKDEFETIWDISGIIGLSGEAHGAVAISLKEETAFRLTSILTGKEYSVIDKEVTDMLGEVVNIIAGNVKNVFEKKHRIKISMPSIIKGRAHSIVWPSEKARIICIPFTIFETQEFCLSIAVEQIK
ncbi:MAG: chemotaxis protein CheX [Treponema sp.]|nr:chemotaxis protein CheX [Treponema sp.]